MAIPALNIAAQGLISSERRATQIAQDIVAGSAAAASSVSATLSVAEGTAGPSAPVNAPTGASSTSPLAGGAGFGDIIQQLVDLRIEESVFRANAEAFSRIDETFGRLLDEES